MSDFPELDEALRKTGWELVGWHAWREAVKVRDALMLVETRGVHGIPGIMRFRGALFPDPRSHPDHYHPADLI